ncbi:F-box only protein 47 [Biomphalaria glabrata]|uniref:F-box only protein 47-like n=1 Tax=Biomphalaria glabrata TaxID=6526 RepID=A0A9U8EI42_BIOGL|nr:F-box only protein 47-like [Biomphalaria glabrata]XP_013088152.2 F-box only protein 47-like [Biomphalaria glabrata]KAI8781098.1 F-box only protein 47 [Biomphalaria glabrata]
MDIKFYLLSKKPRRSSRSSVKEKNVHTVAKKVESFHSCPLGYFDAIPIELRFSIFQFLTIEDLSILTIVSKTMRNLIEGYRVTRFSGPHCMSYRDLHLRLSLEQQTEMLSKYHKLGLLVKRSTCLYATKDRLKIINEFLTRIACSNSDNCKDPSRCIALLCFGKFLHTVIAGWDDSECQRAFDTICQHMCITKHVKTVVSSKPGSHGHLEGVVRQFFRWIFLDQCTTIPDKAFWISRILKPWPIVFQARLLFIIYSGNFTSGEIQWHEMSETTPVDTEHSSIFFSSISSILQLLHLHSTEWTSDEIISIIDEMTSTPEDWLVENIAGLLLACGECLATKLLASKAINGKYVELASIIASLCLVCVKHNHSINQVMTMMDCIIAVIENPREKLVFLNRILDTFKELVLDTHEFTDSDDANDNEFFFHVSALTEFTRKLAHLAYKHILPH